MKKMTIIDAGILIFLIIVIIESFVSQLPDTNYKRSIKIATDYRNIWLKEIRHSDSLEVVFEEAGQCNRSIHKRALGIVTENVCFSQTSGVYSPPALRRNAPK